MLCSACGHDSPAGYRFCGMCGTPLPHRLLETSGAHSTVSLARGPLEIPRPADGQSVGVHDSGDRRSHLDTAAVEASGNESSRPEADTSQEVASPPNNILRPTLVEPIEERPGTPSGWLPSAAPLPEDPAEPFAGSLEHAESKDTEETAADKTPAMPSDVVAFADALAIPAAEPNPPVEAPHFEWMDEVLDEIEVEAAKSAKAHDEPRSSDPLDELPLPEFEPSPVAPNEGPPRYLEISAAPQVSSPARIRVKAPRSQKWRIVAAYAAAMVFAAVVLLQFRSYRNETNDGPIEIVERKIQDWMPDNQEDADSNQPGTLTNPGASTSNSSPQTEQPSKPQDQTVPKTTNATGENSGTAQRATPAAVSPVQGSPAASSNSAQTPPVHADGKTQPPAAPAAPQKSPRPPATQDNEPEVVVESSVPGAAEMAKAKHASDAAAQAAWLWKATAKGNPDAPVMLAEMYMKGDGVPRSCEQAVVLLKTAAINEDVRACNRLASMYATGVCVPRSHVETYHWLSSALAADPNSQWARQNRDLTWKQMTPEERALAEKYR